MAPWIEEKWEYIKADFELAKKVPELITHATLYAMLGQKEIYSKQDARKLHKSQYSSKQYEELMDIREVGSNGKTRKLGYSPNMMLEILKARAAYVIKRGATLNNPHVPAAYISRWKEITEDHAIRLRDFVAEWLKADQPQAHVPSPEQLDIPLVEPQSSQ